MNNRRFFVALSFSSAERLYVRAVANALALTYGYDHVFYDEFRVGELERSDLEGYLPTLYAEQCDLCVAFISSAYCSGGWPGAEWQGISESLLTDPDRVLLVKMGDVRLDAVVGLPEGVTHVDGTTSQAEAVASLVVSRLSQLNTSPVAHRAEVHEALVERQAGADRADPQETQERMLEEQAILLDKLFQNLVARSLDTTNPALKAEFSRLAMQAQAQSRATYLGVEQNTWQLPHRPR
ncbi:MAG: toll/interleukin-1 receptor domain-containing protein [Pseudomonadota bacterium]